MRPVAWLVDASKGTPKAFKLPARLSLHSGLENRRMRPRPQVGHIFFRQTDLSLSMHRRGGGVSTRCIKVVPQPKAASLACLRYGYCKIAPLRNLFRFNMLIYRENMVDCKSAYAGSIPTSASTLRNPVD